MPLSLQDTHWQLVEARDALKRGHRDLQEQLSPFLAPLSLDPESGSQMITPAYVEGLESVWRSFYDLAVRFARARERYQRARTRNGLSDTTEQSESDEDG